VLLHQENQALKYYNLLQQTASRIKGNWSERVSSNLNIADLYLERNNYHRAEYYLKEAQLQAEQDNKDILTSSVNLAWGSYYNQIQDYTTAEKYLLTSKTEAQHYSREQYAKLLKALINTTLKLNKNEEALAYFQQYILLSDSLTTQKTATNLAEMEAVFQNKEKQQQINTQYQALSQAKLRTIILVVGITFLLMVAILLFIIYNNKKRSANALTQSNIKLAEINSELEIANQTKAQLFGIISHDLRAPISQVYQYLNLQQQHLQISNEEQIFWNKQVQEATGHLLETMEELLFWSKTQM
jgi:signal transduction histidine kinase